MVPGLSVVSYAEIGDHLEIEIVGNVDITHPTNQRAEDLSHAFATTR